jgi:hypothetical protein
VGRILVVILERRGSAWRVVTARDATPGGKSLPEVSAVKRPKFIPLRDPAEVPELKTEAEARTFWDTHEVTAEYLERAGPVPDSELPPVRESSRQDLEARLKALARRKGKAGSSCWSGFTRRKSARVSVEAHTLEQTPGLSREQWDSSGLGPRPARHRRPSGADSSTQASWACRRREPWAILL